MTTTAQLIAAEKSRALAAEQKLSDRIAKLEAAHPATVPVPPAPLPAPSTGVPLAYLPTPSAAAPAVGQSIVEAGVRVTGLIAGWSQAYSRLAVDNADGSRIGLFSKYPGRMLDGKTLADLGSFSQISGAVWSNVDPNKLFGVSSDANILYSQDARTGALTKLYTFPNLATSKVGIYGGITMGDGEGGVDDNDHYTALIGRTATGAMRIIVFDLWAKAPIADIAAPAGLNNVQISRKGTWVIAVGSFGTRAYPRDLNTYLELNKAGNHGDSALDGIRELYVANNAPNVVSYDLTTGTATTLLVGSAFEYGHVSGRGPLPILSNYRTDVVQGRPGCDQIDALLPDGSVIPFGFAHRKGTDYAGEVQAVGLRDGKRVLFRSDWDGTVRAFVAERVA